MAEQLTIRVHYPAGEDDRIEVRTDRDWDAVTAATRASADRTQWEFDLGIDGGYGYFKPVLVRGGTVHWSKGENYLALVNGHRYLDVYPYFFEDAKCSACELRLLPSGSGRDHAFRVFHPPGYEENSLKRYPVLYMQDGQNLFFPEEAFNGNHWRIAETLRILDSMNLIREILVVGVYPRNRMEDYTQPGYTDYGRWLVEELKPWIDTHYRTRPEPEQTAVMGSSLGGVVSFYLGWQWPQVFGHAACLSSTFGYRDDLAQRVIDGPKRPIRVYLDSGWPRDNYEVTRNMRRLLRRCGYREGRDLFYLAFPEAAHNEQAWAVRTHIPLQHFFASDGDEKGGEPRPGRS